MTTKQRFLALLLTLMMCITLIPAIPIIAETNPSLTIENIDDQTLRIIQASDNPKSVNWGAEPIVLTIRLIGEDYADVDFTLEIEDPTLINGSFSGLNGNVLTLVSYGETGHTNVTVTAKKGTATTSRTFKVTVNLYEDTGEYDWGNLKIPGGGAVCGYIFHPTQPNILYAQTDVGGAHRFNFETKSWEDMTQWITPSTQGVGQSRGLGIDPTPGRENWVYLSYGSTGRLLVSKDRGDTWINSGDIGISMGGNSGNLRGLGGDNIVVIPNLKDGAQAGSKNPADYDAPTIYAVSNGGIRLSNDDAATWTNINSNFGGSTQYTFVAYDQNNTNLQVVGSARNATTSVDHGTVYFTSDGGNTWSALPGEPVRRSSGSFYFPCKAAFTQPHNQEGDRYLFVTYNDSGSNTAGVNDGNGADGCVFRWEIDIEGNIIGDGVNVTPTMIYETPVKSVAASGTQNRMAGVGMAGLSVDPNIPGALVVSTHNTDPYHVDTRRNQRGMEAIFRSLDYGETWFPILCGYNMFGDLRWGDLAPYAAPAVNGEFNTNRWENPNSDAAATQIASEYWWEPWTFLHWSFGPKINPHDSDMLMLNSGLGTYVTYNLTAIDNIAKIHGNAVPNARKQANLSIEDASSKLFTTTDGRIDTNRRTSSYPAFRIKTADFPTGISVEQSVKWETAPDLFMTVQKASGMFSPPSGKNIVLTNTWDYPGWAFQSLDHLPWNGWSYAQWIDPKWNHLFDGTDSTINWQEYTNNIDPKYLPAKPDDGKNYTIYAPTNRGISGDNTDYPDANPDIIISTARTDWHFNAKGGPIISFDGGMIWHNVPDGWVPNLEGSQQNPPGYALLGVGNGMPTVDRQNNPSTALQTLVETLKGNNSAGGTACGWVTIGADAKTLFWGIATNRYDRLVMTKATNPMGLGQDWFYPIIWANSEGTTEIANNTGIKIVSDRVDPDVFYAFGPSTLYASRDGGLNFYPVTITYEDEITLPMSGLNTVQNAGRQIRGEVGNFGVIWIDGNGLFKLEYDKLTNEAKSTQVIKTDINSEQFGMTGSNGRAGLGLGQTIDGIINTNGALYAHGRTSPVNGDKNTGYGVYRSLDGGSTWTKISESFLNIAGNIEPTGTVEDPYDNRTLAYSDVRSVTGDPRIFGRVYLSQGNVAGGARYGDMIVNLLESGDTIASLFFNDHEGNLLYSTRLNIGTKATTIDAPEKSGFVFDGWYTSLEGGVKFNFNTPLESNTVLYARYSTPTKPTTKPTTEATTKPTTEPTTKPTSKPTLEPTTKPITESTKQVTESIAPTTKSTIEQINQETIQPTQIIGDSEQALNVDLEEGANAVAKADAGAFNESIRIKIRPISKTSEEGIAALEKLSGSINGIEEIALFNIEAITAAGGSVQPNADKTVTITMPIPAGFNPDRIAVAHIKSDGTVEILKSTVKDGMISFTTDSFSVFAIMQMAENQKVEISKTGETSDDSTKVYLFVLMSLLLLAGGFRIYVHSKNKKLISECANLHIGETNTTDDSDSV